MLGYVKPLDTTLGLAEQRLRSPGLQRGGGCLVLRLLGTQALLGVVEELRMEWVSEGWGQYLARSWQGSFG